MPSLESAMDCHHPQFSVTGVCTLCKEHYAEDRDCFPSIDKMVAFDCEQGGPDWFQARLGIVTASEFSTVMAKGKGGAESKTRRTYMLKLIGEMLTGEPQESYTNAHMERGKAMEEEARTYYAFISDNEPKRVGFLRRGRTGYSPDSLIGIEGAHEIKTKLPHLHIECLLSDALPSEHKAQCQGGLWVAEREWVDFQSYWPRLPPFIKRVYRDEEYIKTLAQAVQDFIEEMDALAEKIQRRAA